MFAEGNLNFPLENSSVLVQGVFSPGELQLL